MDARELRIGNLYNDNGKPYQVTPTVIEALWESSERKWFEPIPLTEEWLLRFGFNGMAGSYEFNNGFFEFVWKNNFYIVTEAGEWLPVKIEYVHQLQNLFFALTGTELELK